MFDSSVGASTRAIDGECRSSIAPRLFRCSAAALRQRTASTQPDHAWGRRLHKLSTASAPTVAAPHDRDLTERSAAMGQLQREQRHTGWGRDVDCFPLSRRIPQLVGKHGRQLVWRAVAEAEQRNPLRRLQKESGSRRSRLHQQAGWWDHVFVYVWMCVYVIPVGPGVCSRQNGADKGLYRPN